MYNTSIILINVFIFVSYVTGYEQKISTAQMVRFAVNRPFLFMIIEKSSNLVLFSGSIKDFALETS